jgi:hypothetical protein
LPPRQKGDRIPVMNTLNTIINSMSQTINESVIDDLSTIGFTHKEAVKMVVENDFDFAASTDSYPSENF